MCAISSLTSTFAISSPDEFLYNKDKLTPGLLLLCITDPLRHETGSQIKRLVSHLLVNSVGSSDRSCALASSVRCQLIVSDSVRSHHLRTGGRHQVFQLRRQPQQPAAAAANDNHRMRATSARRRREIPWRAATTITTTTSSANASDDRHRRRLRLQPTVVSDGVRPSDAFDSLAGSCVVHVRDAAMALAIGSPRGQSLTDDTALVGRPRTCRPICADVLHETGAPIDACSTVPHTIATSTERKNGKA